MTSSSQSASFTRTYLLDDDILTQGRQPTSSVFPQHDQTPLLFKTPGWYELARLRFPEQKSRSVVNLYPLRSGKLGKQTTIGAESRGNYLLGYE
eukprot:m.160186 g.160186  ORF g.160186 m.160186 type:complete len:94 (+) comp16356_c0_seq4:316-597(+)